MKAMRQVLIGTSESLSCFLRTFIKAKKLKRANRRSSSKSALTWQKIAIACRMSCGTRGDLKSLPSVAAGVGSVPSKSNTPFTLEGLPSKGITLRGVAQHITNMSERLARAACLPHGSSNWLQRMKHC